MFVNFIKRIPPKSWPARKPMPFTELCQPLGYNALRRNLLNIKYDITHTVIPKIVCFNASENHNCSLKLAAIEIFSEQPNLPAFTLNLVANYKIIMH